MAPQWLGGKVREVGRERGSRFGGKGEEVFQESPAPRKCILLSPHNPFPSFLVLPRSFLLLISRLLTLPILQTFQFTAIFSLLSPIYPSFLPSYVASLDYRNNNNNKDELFAVSHIKEGMSSE